MAIRKLGWLLFIAGMPLAALASTNAPLKLAAPRSFQSARELELWSPAVHDSKFAGVPVTEAASSCEAVNPPQALATPDPLLDEPGSISKVTVSFIVGTDGRVHDPLVLQSSGPAEDSIVLKVVESWRYRPATCNGVPTETEGKIAFSVR